MERVGDLPRSVDMTLVIAHRGASRAEPENSLAAFRAAGAFGADGVELDVRRSSDDRLVIHHDPVVADGRLIRATPARELGLPELVDALDACAGMFVNIEIKNESTEPDFDPTEWIAHRVAAMLQQRRDSPTRWLVSSFRIETIETFRRLMPTVRTGWLVYRPTDEAIDQAARGNHVAVHPQGKFVTAESVRTAHAAGVAINTWTVDDPERMRELMAWGVDGICTNVPDVALAVRADRSG